MFPLCRKAAVCLIRFMTSSKVESMATSPSKCWNSIAVHGGGGVLVSTALMYLLLARVTLQKLPVETSFRPFLGLLTAITKVGFGIILFFQTFVFNGSVSSSLNYLLVIFNFYECTLSPQVVSNSFRSFTSEVGIDL